MDLVEMKMKLTVPYPASPFAVQTFIDPVYGLVLDKFDTSQSCDLMHQNQDSMWNKGIIRESHYRQSLCNLLQGFKT